MIKQSGVAYHIDKSFFNTSLTVELFDNERIEEE